MVLVHRGAASMLDPQDIPVASLAGADWIHLSSIGDRFETLNHLFETVYQQRLKLSWNPGSSVLHALVDSRWQPTRLPIEILFVNKEEWEVVGPLQPRLLETIPQIVVTDGRRGGRIFMNGQLTQTYQGEQVTAVDATGAGDAFVVGYVSSLLLGKNSADAAIFGARNAASVVQQIGAKPGLLSVNDFVSM
jgi:sugar/nucleoside kinase (ribokinase family)